MVREEDDFDPFSDDDPLSDQEREPPQKTASSKALRFSLFVVGGAILAILLTAIAANNAAPNSSQEQLALGINQAARVVLLLGFVGVLVAYRLTQIKKLFDRIPVPSASNPRLVGDGSGTTPSKPAKSGMLSLIITTIVGLIVLWGLMFTLSEALGPTSMLIIEGIQVIFIAVMVTFSIYCQGLIRGFAIGSVSALIASRFESLSALQSMIGFYPYQQPGGIKRTLLTYALSKLTIACIAGLICAALVLLIERKNSTKST